MDDLVLNVRQVYQYPLQSTAAQGDVVLLQQSGPQGNTAGPYGSMNITDIVKQARAAGGGSIGLSATDILSWSPGPAFSFDGTSLNITGTPVTVTQLNASTIKSAGDIFVNGIALADQDWVTALFDSIVESSVWTVNGRKGNVVLGEADIRTAGGVTANSPRFSGIVIAPTPWNLFEYSDRVVTAKWVQNVIACRLKALTTTDINNIYFNSPPGVWPRAPSPALGDASTRIATTAFVDESLEDLADQIQNMLHLDYANLYSPNLTGIPTAPTAPPGTTSGQIATTAFVMQAIVAATAGVSHFNGRTGSVILMDTDIVDAGGALLNSPIFVGTPQAPTAPTGTADNTIASCAFVIGEVAASTAGVSSFNGRSGAVTLSTGDVTQAGGAPLASPGLTGIPTAPTPAGSTNTTQIATTQFVQALVAANSGVITFNGRTGAVNLIANDISAVGGALTASPIFTGQPTAPTAAPGNSTQQLATTAFVASAIAAGGSGVTTFNGRAGAVTLTQADVFAVGGIWSTGDAKLTYKTTPDPGWLMMDDGTIGNVGSGAVHAQANVQALFTLFYNNVLDAWAPLYTQNGASNTTRAAQGTAAQAWAAGCILRLSLVLGRAICAAGAGVGLTSRPLGSNAGTETTTQTAATMFNHAHALPGGDAGPIGASNSPQSIYVVQSNGSAFSSNTAVSGSGAAMSILSPHAFLNVMVCL